MTMKPVSTRSGRSPMRTSTVFVWPPMRCSRSNSSTSCAPSSARAAPRPAMPVPITAIRMRGREGAAGRSTNHDSQRCEGRFDGPTAQQSTVRGGVSMDLHAIATIRDRTTWPSRLVTFAAVAGPPILLAVAMATLWGVAAGPVDLALLVAMYVICGLGISLGFHRYFTHHSFQTGAWFKVTLAILG